MKCPECKQSFEKIAYRVLDQTTTHNLTNLAARPIGIVLLCPHCDVMLGIAPKGSG